MDEDEVKEIGRLLKVPHDIKQIEWRIPSFFRVCQNEDHFQSPRFSFTDDVRWRLELWPHWNNESEEFLAARILVEEEEEGREYDVEFSIGLKPCDGDVEFLISGIFENDDMESDELSLIKKSKLIRRKAKLVFLDVITIIFTMKFKRVRALEEIRPLKLIKLENLSENFKDFLADKETCDVTLKVQDKEYKAHRSVLMARSTVFTATFKHDMLERKTGVIIIQDCDPDSFQEFLEFLYCGKLEELSFHSAQSLYYTSNKYDVAELKAFCIQYLTQHLTVETTCEIAVFADKYDETQLFSKVQEFFNKNYTKVLLTSQWKDLLKTDHKLVDKLLTGMAKMQRRSYFRIFDEESSESEID